VWIADMLNDHAPALFWKRPPSSEMIALPPEDGCGGVTPPDEEAPPGDL
jgi:hypothetical protein